MNIFYNSYYYYHCYIVAILVATMKTIQRNIESDPSSLLSARTATPSIQTVVRAENHSGDFESQSLHPGPEPERPGLSYRRGHCSPRNICAEQENCLSKAMTNDRFGAEHRRTMFFRRFRVEIEYRRWAYMIGPPSYILYLMFQQSSRRRWIRLVRRARASTCLLHGARQAPDS